MAAPRELDLTLTLAQAHGRWCRHLKRRVDLGDFSANTLRAYGMYAGQLVDHCGPDTLIDAIEDEDITDWLAHVRTHRCSPHTFRHCYKIARQFFKHAKVQGWIREDPMTYVPIAPAPGRIDLGPERKALTTDELHAVIKAARLDLGPATHDPAARLRNEIIIRLGGESGLRNSEICNLDDHHLRTLDNGDHIVYIHRSKGGKSRTVPITSRLAALIRAYQQQRPDPATPRADHPHRHYGTTIRGDAGALLRTPTGHRIASQHVKTIVTRCAQHGIGRHLVPHALRHTAATLLLRAGTDLATVAHILGHADVSTTSIYLDTRDEDATAAIRQHPAARPDRPRMSALDVPCPACGADAKRLCRTPSGRRMSEAHAERERTAERASDEPDAA
jgi:integrase/recombinase XerD